MKFFHRNRKTKEEIEEELAQQICAAIDAETETKRARGDLRSTDLKRLASKLVRPRKKLKKLIN